MVQIKDLAKGVSAEGYFLIKTAAIKISANNKKYGDYTLADSTGEINAKLWDVADESACPKVGEIKHIKGLVSEWQGVLQFRMDKIHDIKDEDNVDLAAVIPSAPYSPDEMLATLKEYVNKIQDKQIKSLVIRVLREYSPNLRLHPAALKNHHSIRSGLLYHTTTMLKLAEGILTVYTNLNKDLVYAGVVLHDICKTTEINAGDSGVPLEYSTEGMLVGHIPQGVNAVAQAGKDLEIDKEKVLMLEHMILSHHYEPDFGSPRRPMFPEAEILHYLDMIDTRMYDMENVLASQENGTFSQNIWTLHNRKLYKRTF